MGIAVIAGTGTGGLFELGPWREIPTAYGTAHVADGSVAGRDVVFLRRHGPGMNTSPHLIGYAANMMALNEMGVDRVISTVAVGSLRQSLKPGDLAIVSDFIDFTRHRAFTIFDRLGGGLQHVDFSVPYSPELSAALRQAGQQLGVGELPNVVYVGVDGPRYESPAEIRMFAQWGGDVVGMTGVPEVVLAKELGIAYASLAIITNYAAGISEHPLSHEEVVKAVNARQETIRSLLEKAIGGDG